MSTPINSTSMAAELTAGTSAFFGTRALLNSQEHIYANSVVFVLASGAALTTAGATLPFVLSAGGAAILTREVASRVVPNSVKNAVASVAGLAAACQTHEFFNAATPQAAPIMPTSAGQFVAR